MSETDRRARWLLDKKRRQAELAIWAATEAVRLFADGHPPGSPTWAAFLLGLASSEASIVGEPPPWRNSGTCTIVGLP